MSKANRFFLRNLSDTTLPRMLRLNLEKFNPTYLDICTFFVTFLFIFFAFIELTSLWQGLNRATILLVSGISLILALTIVSKAQPHFKSWKKGKYIQSRSDTFSSFNPNTRVNVFLRISAKIWIFLALSTAFVLDLVMPPNNWDSMTYHIPRMESWFQNGSILNLQSQVDRQIWNPQLGETLLLIPKALNDNDHLLNLIQFLALISIILIFTSLSRSLKIHPNVRLLGIIILFSWPTVLLEATTTQNDIIAALTCLICWIFLVEVKANSSSKLANVLFGISLAVAVATKGTSELFALIAAIIYVYYYLKLKSKKIIPACLVMFPNIINIPLWIQNYHDFGSPLSPKTIPAYNTLITNFFPSSFIENLTRFIGMNLAFPDSSWNAHLTSLVTAILKMLHLSANDPNSTWSGGFSIFISDHEDTAASPLVLTILFTALAIVIIQYRKKNIDQGNLVTFLPIIYFFVSIYVLRNQPWINRLFVPSFILLVLFSLLNITQINSTLMRTFALICIPLSLYGSAFILSSTDKSLISNSKLAIFPTAKSVISLNETQKLFLNQPQIALSYEYQLQRIQAGHFKYIYANIGGDAWEYPLWKFFSQNKNKPQIFSIQKWRGDKKSSAIICLDAPKCSTQNTNTHVFIIGSDDTSAPLNRIFSLNQTYKLDGWFNLPTNDGWSQGESWGTWSDNHNSSIPFVLQTSNMPQTIHVQILAKPFISRKNSDMPVTISLNGKEITKIDFSSAKNQLIKFSFDKNLYLSTSAIPVIKFSMPQIFSPASLGLSKDDRLLGIGVISIRFD